MPSLKILFLVLTLSVVCTESSPWPRSPTAQDRKLHHRMTKREMAIYFGAKSHSDVPEYDVVTPFQADENGGIVTHKLHKFGRTKRSTEQPNIWFFNMRAFGLSLHLNVTKTKNILAPGVVVETTQVNGSKSHTKPPMNAFYSGQVVSHPGSVVAIRNLEGLTGMINLMDQTFFMHPLPDHLAQDYGSSTGGQPHLIYRRYLKDVIGKGCDVTDSQDWPQRESHRTKRSSDQLSPSHKHLEVSMVADNFMVEAYGEENLESHLLMLAHLVNGMFHDDTVGEKKLTVVVVKIFIKKDGLGYSSSANNKFRLAKLTDWGIKNLPLSDKDPGHADLVILVTGSSLGGLALVGSTCATQFGRTVNNDIGLASAIIIAHEAAHTFGVGHDGNEQQCHNGEYIMASAVTDGENAFKWSACSSNRIQEFLTGAGSSCLDNNPQAFIPEPSIFHNKLPGQVMNATTQCRLQYGPEFMQCSQKLADCGSLYCTKDGKRCKSYGAPPVDGTRCGDRHWCIKGDCVDDGSPMIDGGWSEWKDTRPCTRTCGGGVQWRLRTCTNPVPQNGGRKCEGSEKGVWEMCNTEPCPENSKSYRLLQCEAFEKSKVHWGADPCLLSCRRGSLVSPRGRVKDGTRCSSNPSTKDVCIEGICRSVGCDNMLESGAKYDRCAVCEGDSSTCDFVRGEYTKNWFRWGVNAPDHIVTIPVGSTNVFVKMKENTKNLLGVKNEHDEWVYKVAYTWSTVVKAAGTRVAYDHEAVFYRDKVEIPGPTKQLLKIMYVHHRGANPGVEYHFLVPQKIDVSPSDFKWKVGPWDECSEDCAGGTQKRQVDCVRKDDQSYANYEMCLKTSTKPLSTRACNTQPCTPEWYVSDWRACSRTCGKGMQQRVIACRRKISPDYHDVLEDSSCSENKPTGILQRDCSKVSCPPEWKHLSWTECSRSCGGGVMTRSLKCVTLNSNGILATVSDLRCAHAVKPMTREPCNTDIPCPHALTSPDGKHFVPLGCFRDSLRFRALPDLVANLREKIDWRKMEKTVADCAHEVTVKNSTYKVFGIQFYGECWSGKESKDTYSEYGSSRNCWKGVGGTQTNFVYTFVDDEAP